MRIAIFTDLYLEVAGGIPSSIAAQKEALKKDGHEVKVFCPGERCDDGDVVLLPTSWLKINGAPMARRPSAILEFIEEKYPDFQEQFDLIHAHYEAEVSIAAVLVARKYGLPLVQTMHGREDQAITINTPRALQGLISGVLNSLHRKLICPKMNIEVARDKYLATTNAQANMWSIMVRQANEADKVLTPSEHFKLKLEHYGASKPIEVLSNGVADENVDRKWAVRSFQKDYQSEGEKLRIIWSSRVSKEKRIMPFLEALRLLRGYTNDFFFTIAGDGNEFKKAQKFVAKNGLSDNVEFLGAVRHEDVLDMLGTQHLSITNSYGFDTQGLTLLEATATGLPTIFCDEDMKSVIVPGTGMCAKNETPEAMAAMLKHIMAEPELIEKMSRKALESRKEVLQSYWIQKLEDIYKEML
ncbi:MAG: glycosyltransferase [Candidatus Saccharibacteria bacterium]|nr:glycosyltransferase [Candidatus Saccharibacteria bacterium]